MSWRLKGEVSVATISHISSDLTVQPEVEVGVGDRGCGAAIRAGSSLFVRLFGSAQTEEISCIIFSSYCEFHQ